MSNQTTEKISDYIVPHRLFRIKWVDSLGVDGWIPIDEVKYQPFNIESVAY